MEFLIRFFAMILLLLCSVALSYALRKNIPRSSNGKTGAFEAQNAGSTPERGAK